MWTTYFIQIWLFQGSQIWYYNCCHLTYFKNSYKHNKTHHDSTDSNHSSLNQYNKTYSDKHKCKHHNISDQVNEIIGQIHTSETTK